MKRIKISILSFVTVLLLCSCEEKFDYPVSTISFNGPDENDNSPYSELYREILEDYVAQGLPGISITIHTPDHGWWIGCAGMARLEDQTPMNPGHVNHSASMCKPYIAALTLRLIEDGMLGLDDPIKNYLPEDIVNGIANAEVATVRQLLGHTSGIFNFDSNIKMYLDTFNDPLLHPSSKSLFEKYVYGVKAYCEAGEAYHYSNTGYSLLGMIIEEVSGMSLGDYFEQEIIQPLGLENTFYKSSPGYPDAIPNKVNSYFEEYPGQMQNCTDMQNMLTGIAMGHEGVISCSYEYARFIRELMRGNILKSPTIDIMISELSQGPVEILEYGLGIIKWDVDNRISYGHDGNSLGTLGTMMYFPETEMTLAVSVNMGGIFDSENVRNFNFPLVKDLVDAMHTGSRE
jgi:D-alanyl-D-alanine carboxypeptidase